MVKSFKQFLIAGFMAFAPAYAEINDSEQNPNINQLEAQLIDLEKIRKVQQDEFGAKLEAMQPLMATMSADEQCLYQYLSIYKESYKGDYSQSINALKQTKALCETPEYKARVVQFLANLQVITGDFEPALKNLNTAIQITENTEDDYLRSLTNNVAAISYRLMNQDEIALKYADLLISGDFTEDDKCMGGFNKYRILMRQGKGAEYINEIEQAIERCEAVENHIASLFLQLDQVRYQFPQKDSHDSAQALQAVDTLESLEDEVIKTQFKNIKVYYHALMAHMYWIADMNKQAMSYGKLAIAENISIGESEQLILALNVLIQLSLEANTMQPAYLFLAKKNEIEKAVFERKLATQVAYYRVKHANLAQELQIEQLNQNNKLLVLENRLSVETAKKQQLMMLLIVSVLLLLGVWTYKIKKRHDYFKEVAEIDHLTKVFTRKAFEERMKQMMASCKEKQEPINLAIMDLDHFKNVNDQHGHLVGDWVLREVIITCENVADHDIMIARLGGEEFCIVSPGITHQKMIALMEKMRLAITELDCSPSGASFNITASFGISSNGFSGYKTSMLLTHADLALFEAKNKGRNQVVSYASLLKGNAVVRAS
ncbi:tetratricopeptide repeat-containing diguanylate cyclase [Marinicella litoralis]|uniref:diguanylate cyclase n=1 Tax=Marinicella litoralis TaxID=644220 RepID=A0A4R6XIN7_9GAMM|nr:GGDEF domain-containing protein [Marinicella litoralis]TDR19332.1 diguanylate cyclase (GGDEF)-like protein [Marinicella litoralis]